MMEHLGGDASLKDDGSSGDVKRGQAMMLSGTSPLGGQPEKVLPKAKAKGKAKAKAKETAKKGKDDGKKGKGDAKKASEDG